MAPPNATASSRMMAPRGPDHGQEVLKSKKQRYRVEKVVVTQDKKKLRSIVRYNTLGPMMRYISPF